MRPATFFIAILFLSLHPTADGANKPAAPQAAPQLKVIEDGKEVTLAYKLFVNGILLETADSKEPFTYSHGKNQIVPGLERSLAGLGIGEQKTVKVLAKDAYGPIDPKAVREVPVDKIPPDIPREEGTLMEARDAQGLPQLVKIVEVNEKSVLVDFNHPLAGKELEFQVEVLSIK
jgi:FKBP-type peptidyl-prolyl cis-trans isomerase 2